MSDRIVTKSGVEVLITPSDFDALSAKKWHLSGAGRYRYCATWVHGRGHVAMHVLLMQPKEGFVVDHINGNGLDNRRENLRVATVSQNMFNRRSTKNATGFKGVYFRRSSGRYRAEVQAFGRVKHAGYADTPEEAAKLYDAAARKLHGDFAALNFPA